LRVKDRVHLRANRIEPTAAGVTLEATEIHVQNPGDGAVALPPVPASLVSVTALDPDASENGNAPGVFQLARSGDASASLAVSFSLTGSATYGVDYDSPTSVTFPGGHATVNVTLTPKTDSLVEDNESATLTVTAGAGYNLGSPSSATVNIADHVVVPTGPVVTVVATDPLAAEDMSAFGSFTLTRTGNPALELVVTVTVGGSADEAHDYQSIGTSVRFEPGSLTASVAVIAEPDNGDGAETVILTVVAGAGYTPGTPASATVTIPQ